MNFTKLVPNIFYTDIKVGLRFFIECLEFRIGHDELNSDHPFPAYVFIQCVCTGKDFAESAEMVCGSQSRIASGKRYPDTFAGRESRQRLLAEPDRRTCHYGRFFIRYRESIYP